MSVQSTDLKIVLSSVRLVTGNEPTNGGRMAWPWQITTSGAPGEIWPSLFQQQLTAGESLVTKIGLLCIPADNSELSYPEHCIFRPPQTVSIDTYTYWWVGNDTDTGADNNEATADKYGAGVLVAPAGVTAGNQSWTVDVLHADLASGSNAIIKAGYKFRPDARSVYGGSGNNEILEVSTDAISVSGTQVSFTTTAGCSLSYSDGDIGQTFPEVNTALKATIENVDKTGLTGGATTFDESNVEVYSNVPSMDLTLTMEAGALTYSAANDVTGWPNSGSMGGNFSISADKVFVNADDNYLIDMIKIPANAFNGTLSAGDVVILTISPSVYNIWQRVEVLSGAQSGTRTITTGSGGQTV
jgi:hypothetical protein